MADPVIETLEAPSIEGGGIILQKPIQYQQIENDSEKNPHSPFIDSIWPYVELYEYGTGIIRAATDNVLDFSVKWVIDAAGSVSCTFSPADSGLTIIEKDSVTLSLLPFTDTLLSATTPILRAGPDSSLYSAGKVSVGGTAYPPTVFGTPSMDLQMRFSLGGGDFIDAKKMVLNTKSSVDSLTPLIVEEGNSLWEQYGKVVIPHYSVEGVRFIDFMFADPGQIQSYSAVQNAGPAAAAGASSTGSFLASVNTPALTSLSVGVGYISQDATLPYIGGVFKIYCPVNFTSLLEPIKGETFSNLFGSITSSSRFIVDTFTGGVAPFIYLPLINKTLANIPISVDIQAATFTKLLESVVGKISAVAATPYVAHYVEDTSDLYVPLTQQVYPDINTKGTNTVLLGQIFKSNLTFMSSDIKDNMELIEPLLNLPIEGSEFTFPIERYAFKDTTLGNAVTTGVEGSFDPSYMARIEKGITVTPDFSSTWDSAYLIGGSTDCDFPQSGRVTCIRIINDKQSVNGNESWASNIPLVGVYVTDIVGGVYVHVGNQIFTQVSPNFGVYDIQIDPHNNDVYAATGSGVYVCRGFSLLNDNSWTNLGGFNTPVKKIQLNIGIGTAEVPGDYITNENRVQFNEDPLNPAIVPYKGVVVYAMALGTTTSSIGVFSYPINDPTNIAYTTGANPVAIGTYAEVAALAGHPGWDIVCTDQSILAFAVLQDKTVFWANSQNAGLIQSQNFVHPFTTANTATLQYNVTPGDSVAGVANGVQSDNASSDDTVIAGSLIAVQQYPSTDIITKSTVYKDYLLVITNGITANIFSLEMAPYGDGKLRSLPNDGDGGLAAANGELPINLNTLQILPRNTKINEVVTYAIAGTDQGIYASNLPAPDFRFISMNGLNGLDAESIQSVAVGTSYTDIHSFGNSGYKLPVNYSPLWAAGDSTFFESMSGGNWWVNRVQDNVTLAANFYETYKLWVDSNNTLSGSLTPLPEVFRNSQLPPPVPERIVIPIKDIPDTVSGISYYPQGPNYPDLTNIAWIRDRNERGEFYYYIGRVGTPSNPLPLNVLQKGQAVATVSSLAVDDDLITTQLCSDQLALVSKKWFIENSIPPFKVAIESSFTSRFAALRFLRPMHVVHVFFNQNFYTEDGKSHIFIKLDQDLYVIDHEIKYGGDSKPYAITETTLSSEMQNNRTTPDDLAADLQEIVKNLQLRG